MTDFSDFKEEILKDPKMREAYDKLQPKYDLIQKRLEIQEGIARNIHDWVYKPHSHTWRFYGLLSRQQQRKYLKKADKLLTYLHSQGLRLPNGEALIDEAN